MKNVVYIAICCAVLCGCSRPDMEKAVRECASMPVERACATAFVAGGKAYVFAGRDSAGVLHSDLWAYTPTTDSWQNLGETPLSIYRFGVQRQIWCGLLLLARLVGIYAGN